MSGPASLFHRGVPSPAGGQAGSRSAVAADQHARMLDGMARSVARRGYAQVTVADVVAEAGVSRRTFYEQFKDREDCFLAAYRTGADVLIAELEDAGQRAEGGWRGRMRASLRTYLGTLADEPEIARVLLVDVLGAGPDVLAVREEVLQRFVERWAALVDVLRTEEPGHAGVDPLVLRALVSGMDGLIQAKLLGDAAAELPGLAGVLERYAVAVLLGAADPS